MRYSRTFQDLQLKSKSVGKKIVEFFSSWIGTSRFSSHVSLVLLACLVLVFSQFVINAPLSADAAGSNDAWGTFASASTSELGEQLAYQVSDDALVKPNAPFTQESAVRKPTQRTYKVQAGDTFASIAQQVGSTEGDLRKANNLGTDVVAMEGIVLTVPVAKGLWYDVKQGDTVDVIAQKFNIDPDSIIKNNDVVDPQGLAEGRKLVLPGVFPTPTSVPLAAAPTSKPTQAPANSSSKSVPKKSASSAPETRVTADPPPGGSASFGWPVNPGSVYQSQGFHGGHPGWDLASYGSKNVPVFAAAAGRVVHASWSTAGYGNEVLIDHQNGYTTLYGHFYKIYVSNGDWVKRGQVLGLMGTTGHSTGVHLHFEICTNSRCQGYSTGTRLNPGRFL
ncbi:MAG: M23 family metallopeptidase [bacterium]